MRRVSSRLRQSRGWVRFDRFTIAGTPAECRVQLQRLLQGWRERVHQLGVYPLSPTPDGRETTLRLFMTEVAQQIGT